MDNRNVEILKIFSGSNGKHKRYKCKCNDCGREYFVYSHNFKAGKGCVCKKHLYQDLTGKEIGKIKILELISRAKNINNKRGHLYKCECKYCNKEYEYHSSAINRKDFKGCKCNISDLNHASKKRVFKSYQLGAKKRDLKFDLTFEQTIKLCSENCHYCDSEPNNISKAKDTFGEFKYNGIDRLNNKKGYTLKNTVSCCKVCNWMKQKMTVDEFFEHINKIHNKALGWIK